MKIGLIVAMEKELRQLQSLLEDVVRCDGSFVSGRMGENEIVLMQCGIGKVNAALGASELIRRCGPDAIVSSGCAGGNGADVNVLDVVVSTELAYHDVYCGSAVGSTVYGQVQGMPSRFAASPCLLEKAKKLSCSSVHAGLIVTGDWFVDTREKMEQIVVHFPEAKAVDMESAAIAQTCYVYGVPFISFRIISDVPLRDTDASQYHDFWSRLSDGSFAVTRQFLELL